MRARCRAEPFNPANNVCPATLKAIVDGPKGPVTG